MPAVLPVQPKGQVFTADGTEHGMREAFVARDISRTDNLRAC